MYVQVYVQCINVIKFSELDTSLPVLYNAKIIFLNCFVNLSLIVLDALIICKLQQCYAADWNTGHRQILHLLKTEMCFLCKSVDKGYFLEIDPSWLHRSRSMSIQSSCNSRKFTFHCYFAVSLVKRVENSAGKLQEIYIKFSWRSMLLFSNFPLYHISIVFSIFFGQSL